MIAAMHEDRGAAEMWLRPDMMPKASDHVPVCSDDPERLIDIGLCLCAG